MCARTPSSEILGKAVVVVVEVVVVVVVVVLGGSWMWGTVKPNNKATKANQRFVTILGDWNKKLR